MHDLHMISGYRNCRAYCESFFRLAREVFAIRFDEWFAAGFWSNEYICYSFVHGDRVVANASTNWMNLLLDGQKIRATQVGTVMTHPDYRGRGLGRRLLETILDKHRADDTPVYLMGDGEAAGFYRKLDLQVMRPARFVMDLPARRGRPSTLNPLGRSPEDLALIHEFGRSRSAVSRAFGVRGAEHILLWYCFNLLRDHFYRPVGHDAIVICRQEGGTFHPFDIVTIDEPNLERLLYDITPLSIEKVEFHFIPDRFGVGIRTARDKTGDQLFATPGLASLIPEDFRHPATAQA